MALAAMLLAIAIGVEVAATALLPRTAGFTSPAWTLLVCAGYALSITLLALVVREIPVSIAYAVWSGAGTALVATIGVLFLGERLDVLKVAAITLIVVGVVALNISGAS
ncbi:MAG: multidrug efflux SMR transporter [Nocardioidaceae bacterium]|nr:multidrug efflux SMR transporter [Nocardioidaceae bacterium]MDQ3165399.1 multidrug efflux SMR transporter [Actinomycetota bacterium]